MTWEGTGWLEEGPGRLRGKSIDSHLMEKLSMGSWPTIHSMGLIWQCYLLVQTWKQFSIWQELPLLGLSRGHAAEPGASANCPPGLL